MDASAGPRRAIVTWVSTGRLQCPLQNTLGRLLLLTSRRPTPALRCHYIQLGRSNWSQRVTVTNPPVPPARLDRLDLEALEDPVVLPGLPDRRHPLVRQGLLARFGPAALEDPNTRQPKGLALRYSRVKAS